MNDKLLEVVNDRETFYVAAEAEDLFVRIDFGINDPQNAELVGRCLADVARSIALHYGPDPKHPERPHIFTDRFDRSVFAGICAGFIAAVSK
jgi:hypothetical protein